VGSDLYFFNLLGFSVDGGLTFQSVFSSPEGGHNSALLYGQLTREQVVPEPANLLLLGGGLTALATRLRRARASAPRV